MERNRLLVTVIATVIVIAVVTGLYFVLRRPSGPPTQDVSGVDIPDVPRYPGSVRSWGEPTSAGYYTSAGVNTVANWYDSELPGYGWEHVSIAPWVGGAFEGDMMLTASKNSRSLSMTVAKSSKYEGYTLIGIGITAT
jgi:hypothetical protein